MAFSDPGHSLPTVAAFDFDGTLTKRDTFLPFLVRVGPMRFLLALIVCAPALCGYALGLLSRDCAKQMLCKAVLRGRSRAELAAFAESWFDGIALRPQTLARLKWHQEHGHRCVMISASLDVYLETAARRLGFDDLLCTRLAVDSGGRVTGNFDSPNCWGAEKVRRLREHCGPADGYRLHAYGDSRGDSCLLDAAEQAWLRGTQIKP